jgi:membrane-associated protease RseP (regulator of RpoE activity)
MTKKQDERRSFSYHEAGHAVVAWSLGFRVSKVSIGMDGTKLLEANKKQAIKVAEYLIEHGKIDGVAVERLFPV